MISVIHYMNEIEINMDRYTSEELNISFNTLVTIGKILEKYIDLVEFNARREPFDMGYINSPIPLSKSLLKGYINSVSDKIMDYVLIVI